MMGMEDKLYVVRFLDNILAASDNKEAAVRLAKALWVTKLKEDLEEEDFNITALEQSGDSWILDWDAPDRKLTAREFEELSRGADAKGKLMAKAYIAELENLERVSGSAKRR